MDIYQNRIVVTADNAETVVRNAAFMNNTRIIFIEVDRRRYSLKETVRCTITGSEKQINNTIKYIRNKIDA